MKIISPFLNFRNSLKIEKIKEKVDLLFIMKNFNSFLNDKNENFSNQEKELLIYAPLVELTPLINYL